MKNIISILAVLIMFGSADISVAKADEISNMVANEVLKQYNKLRKKAKGDKKMLSKLASIKNSTLKKVSKTPGLPSRKIGIAGVKKMRLVVKK